METEPVASENTPSMGEGENKKPKAIDIEIDLTSPPAKKLKQARLPFKVLTPKSASSPVASSPCQKKRKLSSEQSGPQKQAKTLKNNDSAVIGTATVDSGANETVSSSELEEASKTPKRSDDKSKSSGLLDRFVRVTQQKEVSTTVPSSSCDSKVKCDDRDGDKERQPNNLESAKPRVDCVDSADNKSQATDESLTAAQSMTKGDSVQSVITSAIQCSNSEQSGTSEVNPQVSIIEKRGSEAEVESLNGSGSVPVETNDHSPVADALASQDIRHESRLGSDVKTEMTTVCHDISVKSNVSSYDESGTVENDCTYLDDSPKEGSSTLDVTDSSEISVIVSQNSSTSEDQKSADEVSEKDSTPKRADQSSPGHQSSDSTPKTSRGSSARSKKNTSSSRRNSDTQKERELARLEKQKQKEAARAEKERQRLEAKAKKEQERLEAKRKKEEERLRLQKEREEKLQQKEEEKKKKQLEKEEERRRRQELIDAKKKKDEERLRAEEELKLKKEKEKALFTKFFTKSEKPPPSAKSVEEKTGPFIAFEVKDNMRLAPEFRIDESVKQEKAANVDKAIQMQDSSTLYLEELKQKSYKPGCSSKTWPLACDVDIEIIPNNPTYHLRAKLLQFHENYRPAYYGTWRKHSHVIKPRNPLQKDQDLLDYEVDSDEEWEEEEPGESLSHSEGEGSDDEKEDVADDEDEDDGFFVPHGYLSEGEGCEDDEEDTSPERLKARQLAKAKAWEAEMKRRKFEVLRPVCIGCLWADLGEVLQRNAEWDKLQQYAAIPLVTTPIPVSVTPATEQVTSSKLVHKEKGTKFRPVPKEAVPDLIRLVHGSVHCLQKLVKEFTEYWRRKSLGLNLVNADNMSEASQGAESRDPHAVTKPNKTDDCENAPDGATNGIGTGELGTNPNGKNVYLISKRQLMSQIRVLAVYEKQPDIYKKCCWYVHKEILEKYGLSDLTVPTKWQWLTHLNASKQPAKTNTVAVSQAHQKTAAQTSTNNIRQFAVANLSPSDEEKKALPLLISPPSVPPARQGNLKTSTPICSRKRPLTPSALFSKKQGEKSKANQIVTPVKAKDSFQKTLVSMFSPPLKQNSSKVIVESTTGSPSSASCRAGDSEESPMVID